MITPLPTLAPSPVPTNITLLACQPFENRPEHWSGHRGRWASITSISGPLGACSFGLLKVCRLGSFESPKEHTPRGPLMLVMLAHLPRKQLLSYIWTLADDIYRGRWASITSISGPLGSCSFGLSKVCRLSSFKSPKKHAPRGPLMLVMLAHLHRNNPLMATGHSKTGLNIGPAIRKQASTLVQPFENRPQHWSPPL